MATENDQAERGRVIAVTGVRSFVGSEIIKRLEEDASVEAVLALDIRRPAFPLDKTQYVRVDLTLPNVDATLAELLADHHVDTLLHGAFLSHPTHNSAWAHELEDIGSMHVINACAEANVHKLVLSSTTMVYGARPHNPNFLSEEHELRGQPGSRYVTDRVGAEKMAQRFQSEHPERIVTSLRVAATLGPTVKNYATRFFSRPVAPVLMGYDPLVQLVHEQDVVDAHKLALDGEFRGAYNIAGDGVLPYSTVLAMMGKFPLPLPHFLARPLVGALWATQVVDAPPTFLDFLRYLCIVDGKKARDHMAFWPRYDLKATIYDFLGLSKRGDYFESDEQTVETGT